MADDRRLEPRYALTVPIRVAGVEATTINVSLSGVSFKSPVPFPVSETIAFSVLLRSPFAPVQMDCRGVVTRADPEDGGFVVAATIDQFRIASENAAGVAKAFPAHV
ncbi:MAG TPA: PilZ domain-containing protein [Thermoanaerobaculia bacterium]